MEVWHEKVQSEKDDGDHQYVEIAFWLDGETAEAEAQEIISTLTFIQR